MDDTYQGSVYLFERNSGGADAWGQVKKITAADGVSGDFFGNSVSLNGDHMAVGAYRDDISQGSAYLFERNTGGEDAWGQVKKLIAADGAIHDNFGTAVSLNSDRLVVGARGYFGQPGASYLFERNYGGSDAWGQVAKLTPVDGADDNEFGFAVSLVGDTLVVGDIGDEYMANNNGRAYVYNILQTGPAGQPIARPTAADGEANDRFGWSVSMNGDLMAVGAYKDDDRALDAGAVYLFERNTGGADAWGQVVKISAADGAEYDNFGWSVSLVGDRLAVGAFGYDLGRGAVYLFERNSGGADAWGQVKKLAAADGVQGDCFGKAVSLNGDRLAVGANGCENKQGAAYLFERNRGGADAWGQVAKLTASDGAMIDLFGWSLSLSDDTLAVGAWWVDGQRGAVYLYGRNSGGVDAWGEMKKLTAANGTGIACFGSSVSLDGDTLAVGAMGEDNAQGAAYLFERNRGGANAWGQVTRIIAADRAEEDRFGGAVSLSGDRLAVGAHADDSNRGAAYLFERNTGGADAWGQVDKLTVADGAEQDYFGRAVSLSGDRLVVGAYGVDNNQGAAYIFAWVARQVFLPMIQR